MAASASPSGNGAQQQTVATQNAVMALFSRLKEVAAGMLAEVRGCPQVVTEFLDMCYHAENVVPSHPPPPPPLGDAILSCAPETSRANRT